MKQKSIAVNVGIRTESGFYTSNKSSRTKSESNQNDKRTTYGGLGGDGGSGGGGHRRVQLHDLSERTNHVSVPIDWPSIDRPTSSNNNKNTNNEAHIARSRDKTKRPTAHLNFGRVGLVFVLLLLALVLLRSSRGLFDAMRFVVGTIALLLLMRTNERVSNEKRRHPVVVVTGTFFVSGVAFFSSVFFAAATAVVVVVLLRVRADVRINVNNRCKSARETRNDSLRSEPWLSSCPRTTTTLRSTFRRRQ